MLLGVGDRLFPPHLARIARDANPSAPFSRSGKEVSGPYTSLIANRPYPYPIQRASIGSIPDNIAQPSLHHRPRWCKPETTMHHVIKHLATNSVKHRNNESPESSYIDPAKGRPRAEAPVRCSGRPLARRTYTSLLVTTKKVDRCRCAACPGYATSRER